MQAKLFSTFVLGSILIASSAFSVNASAQSAEQVCGRDPSVIAHENSVKWRECEIAADVVINTNQDIRNHEYSSYTGYPVSDESRQSMFEQLDWWMAQYSNLGCALECGNPDRRNSCPSQDIDWSEVERKRETRRACLRDWQIRRDNDSRPVEQSPNPTPSNGADPQQGSGQTGGGNGNSEGGGLYLGSGSSANAGGGYVPSANPSNAPTGDMRCWDVVSDGVRVFGGCE